MQQSFAAVSAVRLQEYPFEVALPPSCPVRGVAFADQVKCLDGRARRARPIGRLPEAVVSDLLARTRALLE